MKDTMTRAVVLMLFLDLIGESAEEVEAETGNKCMDCAVLVKLVIKVRKALLVEEGAMADNMRKRYGLVDTKS